MRALSSSDNWTGNGATFGRRHSNPVLALLPDRGVRMKSRTVLIAVASSWLRAHGLISAGVTHVG